MSAGRRAPVFSCGFTYGEQSQLQSCPGATPAAPTSHRATRDYGYERAMAKAAIQTAAKSLNGMTLGSGLAIGGLALGLGGWQLGSAIDKATDHSYRALLAAEHWGARIDNIDVKEWGRRADEAAQTWKGAGIELKRQSELWRETTAAAAEASAHVVAHSNLLLALEKNESAEQRVAAHPRLVSELALAAGAIEDPQSIRSLAALARTLARKE